MGNDRLHAFKLNRYAYLAVDATDKESVHLLIVPPTAPESPEDAADQQAIHLLRELAFLSAREESKVMVEGHLAECYDINTSMLAVLHSFCDLSAKVSYRYQRVRSLSMQAELPLGVG